MPDRALHSSWFLPEGRFFLSGTYAAAGVLSLFFVAHLSMTFFLTIAAFIVALGTLIVFHEFGHFLVARWCGVKVLRFSVGFGYPLIRKRFGKDQTEWVVAAFPLGGYVKMLDEREGTVAPEELSRSFNRKPVSRRFAIVAAGPVANFLLAIVLYWLLFMAGVSTIKPILGPVAPATPAALAGFEKGDTVLEIQGEAVANWQDVRWLLLKHAVEKSRITIETLDVHGVTAHRELNLNNIDADDLDGDFLKKIGLSSYQPEFKPIISQVTPGSAAREAGLRAGDEILAVNGREILLWEDLVQQIRTSPGILLTLEIHRDGRTMEVKVTPDVVTESGKKIGKLGVGPQIDQEELEKLMMEVSYPPGEAVAKAIFKTWETSVFTLQMLWKMVVGEVSWRNVSGPITIADYAGKSAQMGLTPYLSFLALISISLGVLNLLPIPVLDGGHLMYYVVEIVKGSPLSVKTIEIGQQVGVALLFALMAFAIYNDISRFIPS